MIIYMYNVYQLKNVIFFTNLHDGEKKISIASSVATFPRPTCPNKMQNCQAIGPLFFC